MWSEELLWNEHSRTAWDPVRCGKGWRTVPNEIKNDGYCLKISASLHGAHRVNHLANTPHPGKQPGAASGAKSVTAFAHDL